MLRTDCEPVARRSHLHVGGVIVIATAVLVVSQAAAQGTQAPAASAARDGAATPSSTASTKTPSLAWTLGQAGTVRVPAGSTMLVVTGVVSSDTTPEALANLAASVAIVDEGSVNATTEATPAVKFLPPQFIGRSGSNGMAWRVPIEVATLPATPVARFAKVTYGSPESQFAIEYTLSAKPAAPLQWSVRGSADTWTVSWSDNAAGRSYGVAIENPDEQLIGLKLAGNTLKDSSGRLLGDRLLLSESNDGKQAVGANGTDVPGNDLKRLFLRLDAGQADELHGTFDGVVRFTASGSVATKDLPLKIQISSDARRIWGVLLALMGLLCAVFLSALLRPQMARLQVQRLVAGVQDAIDDFRVELAAKMQPVDKEFTSKAMLEVCKKLAASINERQLSREGLLPPRWALPGAEPITDVAPKLKTRLDSVSAHLEGLQVLLRQGVPKLIALYTTDPSTALQLLKKLDECAEASTNAELATGHIAKVHAHMTKTEAVAASTPMTAQQIDLRLQSLAAVTWSLWTLISLVVAIAWITADVDFGTITDLVGSFLWGLGMTALGASLGNLSPTSTTTLMSIKLPK